MSQTNQKKLLESDVMEQKKSNRPTCTVGHVLYTEFDGV